MRYADDILKNSSEEPMNKKDKENLENQNEEEVLQDSEKRAYTKPQIQTEELITFGAACNGMAVGGRKASTGAPNFCQANRLLS